MNMEANQPTCPQCGTPIAADREPCCPLSNQKLEPPPEGAEVITHSGQPITIKSRWFRLGRDAENDIVLQNDDYVSRYHAWITYEQGKFWIEDLGSTNGTLLNGEPLRARGTLSTGDKIKIGDSEMTFVLLEKTGSES